MVQDIKPANKKKVSKDFYGLCKIFKIFWHSLWFGDAM